MEQQKTPDIVGTKANVISVESPTTPRVARASGPAPSLGEVHAEEHHLSPRDLVRIAFVALACAAVWFRIWEPLPNISVIGITAALIGMYPIIKEAFEAVRARRMTMELSMTIALIAALLIGETFTALLITGVLTPVMAALMHVGSELMFIANAARLVPRGAASS